MSITVQSIKENIKTAMLAKDNETVKRLKYILGEYETTIKKPNKENTSIEEVVNALKKAAEKGIDSFKVTCSESGIDYETNSYYIDTMKDIEVYKSMLPKEITSDEVMEYLTSNGVNKNMRDCMQSLKSTFGTALDGKMASEIAKKYVNS